VGVVVITVAVNVGVVFGVVIGVALGVSVWAHDESTKIITILNTRNSFIVLMALSLMRLF
jgi:hypothetical protein